MCGGYSGCIAGDQCHAYDHGEIITESKCLHHNFTWCPGPTPTPAPAPGPAGLCMNSCGAMPCAYCDDTGCCDSHETGGGCKERNPHAHVTCSGVGTPAPTPGPVGLCTQSCGEMPCAYCDDTGCCTSGTGEYCKNQNPDAHATCSGTASGTPAPAPTPVGSE